MASVNQEIPIDGNHGEFLIIRLFAHHNEAKICKIRTEIAIGRRQCTHPAQVIVHEKVQLDKPRFHQRYNNG